MFSNHPAHAGIHCRSHAQSAFLPRAIGCFTSGGFFFHDANVTQTDDRRIPSTNYVRAYRPHVPHLYGDLGQAVRLFGNTPMSQPSKCNPDSAMPMRGLSKRAQKQLAPKSYGQQPPKVSARYRNEIPQALRTKGTA
jgi:hypothetical protein